MKEIVKLSVRGLVYTDQTKNLSVNGQGLGETLGKLFGTRYEPDCLVEVTILSEEKEVAKNETV